MYVENPMYVSCLAKQEGVKALFHSCRDEEAKYSKIIELGRALPPLDPAFKTPEHFVKGCQSIMYLRSYLRDGLVFFEAESDALISSGLAALLVKVYSGEEPETILKCPPTYLEDLGIRASLSPNRASGLYSIFLRMKQDALKFLIERPLA
jgi:cysteine desulfuration protein SufE